MRRVVLVNFPLRVAVRAYEYKEALLREFAIVALAGGEDAEIPKRLVDITSMWEDQYSGLNPDTDKQIERAVAQGQTHLDLELMIPEAVRHDTLDLAALLSEADAYCRSGELLTLAPTDEVRAFWIWFLLEFVRQVSGLPPHPWRDFTFAQ
jgi:hypothetical protein